MLTYLTSMDFMRADAHTTKKIIALAYVGDEIFKVEVWTKKSCFFSPR